MGETDIPVLKEEKNTDALASTEHGRGGVKSRLSSIMLKPKKILIPIRNFATYILANSTL